MINEYLTAETAKPVRHFLPANIQLRSWEDIQPFYKELESRDIESTEALEQWLKDVSELEAFVDEEGRWRYIHVSVNTMNKEAEKALQYLYSEIEPNIKAANFQLNKKLVQCPYLDQLNQEKYFVYLRGVRKQLSIFRETNLPLLKEQSIKQNEYGVITSRMTIDYDNQALTLPQAKNFLKDKDRSLREEVYYKINMRLLEDKDALDKLFDGLLGLRNQIAANADFPNFRDYMFTSLGRFDYTSDDCIAFHESVAREVTPLVKQLQDERKEALELDTLRPWDLGVDIMGGQPLHPFEGGDDLANKTIQCLSLLDPFFSHCLKTMREMDRLDLDSRVGKAPGGYNMSLPETGVPFIFMNAAGADRDVTTIVHEAGHAVHSFLSHPLELDGFKQYPSEVAELASMSMELFTMGHWNVYYPDHEQLAQSQKTQLEHVIKVLPWIATVDKFQHWIYLNPGHSVEKRKQAWARIYDEFNPGVDWSGLEEHKAYSWQGQLHLYEVPFYYIEYGMAQLGAVAMWKQYKENPANAINNYKEALKLGYTRTIGEIYQTAGINFRFDQAYIRELMQFLIEEYRKL